MNAPRLFAQTCGCPDPAYDLSGRVSVSYLIAHNVLPGDGFTGPCLSIDGVLEITEDYAFNGVEFIMHPGAEILVKAGHMLTIGNGSGLHGCDTMWTGIILEGDDPNTMPQSGGILDMSESSIRDAEYAVWARDFSFVRLVDNDFINNYVGFYVAPAPGTATFPQVSMIGMNPLNFAGNDFEYRANETYLPYNSIADNIEVGLAGILIHHAQNIALGQEVNRVKGSRYGGGLWFSNNIGLYNFEITELTNTNSSPVVTAQTSTGIHISRCQIVEISECQIVENVQNGIVNQRFDISMDFHDNRISVENYGIYCSNSSLEMLDVRLNDNVITANTAIQVQNIPYLNDVTKELYIQGNIINPTKYGIYLANTGPDYQITDNEIDLPAMTDASGIVGQMIEGVGFVTHNTIQWYDYLQPGGYGIHFSATRDFHISENHISYDGSTEDPFMECGIRLDGSFDGVICCNDIDFTSRGIYFTGVSDPKVYLLTNIFGRHKTGLELAPGAVLSAQVNPGNDWTNADCAIDALYNGNFAQAILNAPYRTDPDNIPAMLISPAGWFNLNGDDPSCTDTGYECGVIGEEPEELDPTTLLALEEEPDPELAGGWFAQRRALYRHLQANPHLIEWSTEVTNFYDDAAEGFLGALYEVEEADAALGQQESELAEDIGELTEALQDAKAELNDLLSQYPEAMPAQQADLLEDIYALAQTMSADNQALEALLEQAEEDYKDRLDDLLALNAALDPQEVYEENAQAVNDLLFQLQGGLIESFNSTQQAWIDALAASCPQEHGPAVYTARRLQKEYVGHIFYDDSENCGLQEARPRSAVANKQKAVSIQVTPNPATNQAVLYFDGSVHTIRVYDLRGKIWLSSCLPFAQSNSVTLPLTDFPPGIYRVAAFADNDVIATAQLVVVQ